MALMIALNAGLSFMLTAIIVVGLTCAILAERRGPHALVARRRRTLHLPTARPTLV